MKLFRTGLGTDKQEEEKEEEDDSTVLCMP